MKRKRYWYPQTHLKSRGFTRMKRKPNLHPPHFKKANHQFTRMKRKPLSRRS
jgi:hypothetical protein